MREVGMQAHNSSIDLAIKHYSSLFKIPPFRFAVALLCLENLTLGLMVNAPHTSTLKWIVNGLLLGLIFFTATVLSDYLLAESLLKKDVILNFRRILFLSFSSNIFLSFSAAISSMTAPQDSSGDLFIKIFSLGFFSALSLRLLVVNSISFLSVAAKILSSILQPSIIFTLTFIVRVGSFYTCYIFYYISALAASILSVNFFMKILNEEGMKKFGIPSLKIFRAFLADWTESFEKPFEEILDKIGEECDVTVSSIIFNDKRDGGIKAIIVVPNIHPGPFKNVGSSPLPSLIENFLEKEFKCVTSVPHGISGHELDLVSQSENKKIIDGVISTIKETRSFSSKVTNFFIIERDIAKVGCQIFNGCILLTLTTAPKTIEDLPLELNDIIMRMANEAGFTWAIAIDAHNSINGQFEREKTIEMFKDAVSLALEKAKNLEYSSDAIKVGAGKIIPEDLSITDGMGPGGVTCVLIEVNGQRTAYVTIDGNNMVSGLREKILSGLRELGINHGEVFTTDTHIVNAVVLSRRGYHPIGEAIDHNKLISYVKCAVLEALGNMSPAEVAWNKTVIPKVKVIGEKQINELSLLADTGLKKAKKCSIIFLISGLLLTVFLMLT
jgi:putative membrane protein